MGGEEGEGNGGCVRTRRRNREIHAGMCTGIGMVEGRVKSWERGVEERENSGEGMRLSGNRRQVLGVGNRRGRERVWLTTEVGVLVLDAEGGGEIDGVRREGIHGNGGIAGEGVGEIEEGVRRESMRDVVSGGCGKVCDGVGCESGRVNR